MTRSKLTLEDVIYSEAENRVDKKTRGFIELPKDWQEMVNEEVENIYYELMDLVNRSSQ